MPQNRSLILPGHMCHGLNSKYFHIIGDGHQPKRLYIPRTRIPYWRWDEFIPNMRSWSTRRHICLKPVASLAGALKVACVLCYFCIPQLEGNIPSMIIPPPSPSPLYKKEILRWILSKNDESSQFWYSCSTCSISFGLNKSQIWSRPKTFETNWDDPSQSGCDPVILKGSEGKMGKRQIRFLFGGFA